MVKHLTAFIYILSDFFSVSSLIFCITTSLAFAQQLGKYFELVFPQTAPANITKLFLLSLLPNIILITIPIALSVGAVITCSRFSADNEFLALQSSGAGWCKLAVPFLTLALMASFLMAYLSIILIPSSLQKAKNSRQQLSVKDISSAIKPKGLVTAVPNVLLFLRDIDSSTGGWSGVFLVNKSAKPDMFHLSLARKGEIVMPPQRNDAIEAHLLDCLSVESSFAAPIESSAKSKRLVVKFPDATERTETAAEQVSYAEMSFAEVSQAARRDSNSRAATEWHKRLAFPFSGLLLTVASFFVATSAKGKRAFARSRAVAISLSLSLSYYLIFTVGQNLSLHKALPIWLSVWAANICFLLLGIIFLISRNFVPAPYFGTLFFFKEGEKPVKPRRKMPPGARSRWRNLAPFNLISYLLVSDFTKYFLLSISSLISILVIFTLFDVIPAANKNQISYLYLLSYLSSLIPQLFYFSAPFALLLGLCLSFGILRKTRQMLAIASVGQGKAQLTVIIVLIGLAASFSLLYFSDHVLPGFNRSQDAKHRVIKGKRPEDTVSAFNKSWIYGKDQTIYAYDWIDSNNSFSRLAAYKIHNDVGVELTSADQAMQVSATLWRTPKSKRESIAPSNELLVRGPQEVTLIAIEDGPEIFKPTANEASKIDLRTMKESIRRVRSLGLDVYNLQVDLAKRISFPMSCLTLALLAMPFILSNNLRRSGTLFYIGLGAGVGLIFWLLMTFFEVIGRQRWLPVNLAIWAPQIIFSSVGIYFSLYQARRHKGSTK